MQFFPPQNIYSYKDEVMAYLPKEHNETSGWKAIIYPNERLLQQEKIKTAQKEQHCLTSPFFPHCFPEWLWKAARSSYTRDDITSNSLFSEAIAKLVGC